MVTEALCVIVIVDAAALQATIDDLNKQLLDEQTASKYLQGLLVSIWAVINPTVCLIIVRYNRTYMNL